MAQEYFVGWEGPQQARAQAARYQDQANLIAGRADDQVARDNLFDFNVRNQLANEETQRFQFARQDAAAATDRSVQDRNFFANQAQNRAQETRLDAQGKREEEKLRFDFNRFEKDDTRRNENSAFMGESFASTLGSTLERQSRLKPELDAATVAWDTAVAEALGKDATWDNAKGQFVSIGMTQLTPEVSSNLTRKGIKARTDLQRLTEDRNILEKELANLDAHALSKDLYVFRPPGGTGLAVRDGLTGKVTPVPRPIPPSEATGLLPGLRAEIMRLNPGTSPTYGRMLKQRIQQAGLTGQISREAAALLLQSNGLDRF